MSYFSELCRDLRHSLRHFIKNPGFATVAVISLALGIGATTVVFSVVYAALIDPYPYAGVDRIVRLSLQTPSIPTYGVTLNGPQIQQMQQISIVESIFATDYHAMTMTGHDIPQNVDEIGLIASAYQDLGVPPILGRNLLASDALESDDSQRVVLLSHKFWRSHFLSNKNVIGQTIELDHKDYTIVGVAAPRFTWYYADVFLPLKLSYDPASLYIVNFRLRPGVTPALANAALQPLVNQFAKDMPQHFPEQFRVHVEGLNEWVVRSISRTLYLLLGAVALLLVIGCTNVSILLLARGTARQHELALRSAVGASRPRIVRQLLTESMLLAIAGGFIGVLASYGMLAGLEALLPRYAFAPEVDIRINLPVLFFSLSVALLTGFLFGLWPALQLSQTQLGQAIQSNVRTVAGSALGRRTNDVVVAGQIALTLLLLAASGSSMASFVKLLHKPLGYDPHNVMSVGVPIHQGSYSTWAARGGYFEQLRAKAAETPGVTATAISGNATPPHNGMDLRFEIMGKPSGQGDMALFNVVNHEYFSILRISLLQGRIWDEREDRDGAHIAVVNRTLAQLYFPSGNALGHSIKVPGIEDRPPEIVAGPNIANSWLVIVGIVEDAQNDGLSKAIKPSIFVPYTLEMWRATQILVRSEVPPLTLLHAVQKQLTAVNPEQQTFSRVQNLDTWVSNQPEWQQEHLAAWIFAILAWFALALAAVGLYSVVSYAVAQRTNEFGVRIALGAQRKDVKKLVLLSTLQTAGSGIAVGLTLTLLLNAVLAKWTGGNLHDPIILVVAALLLCFLAGFASAVPAHHASKIDPMTALRQE